jgi:hypothetical protein
MSQRAEAMEEQRAKHTSRAWVITLFCTAIVVVYTAFLLLMVTHMPHTLAEEKDLTGMWSVEVTMEWDHLVVDHTSDLSKGNMDWEVTGEPGNETLETGSHEQKGDDVIIVDIGKGGTYGVHLTPSGVNSGIAYDVTVQEFYISPATIMLLRMAALFVLALLVPFLYYPLRASQTAKFRDAYKTAWMTMALTIVLSAIIGFFPWV